MIGNKEQKQKIKRYLRERKRIHFFNEFSNFRCKCRMGLLYRCRIWNEVLEGFEYSTFYRKSGKSFHSKLTSDPVDLSIFITAKARGINLRIIFVDFVKEFSCTSKFMVQIRIFLGFQDVYLSLCIESIIPRNFERHCY